MKKLTVILSIAVLFAACGQNNDTHSASESDLFDSSSIAVKNDNPSYDPHRGEGKFKKVELGDRLDMALAESGEKIYSVKCSGCHKTTGERLVGPGWLGVTKRNTAEWNMNFVTNTDVMLEKDPKAQAQLELCLVRMPNQSVSDNDARALLEYMRKIDGVK